MKWNPVFHIISYTVKMLGLEVTKTMLALSWTASALQGWHHQKVCWTLWLWYNQFLFQIPCHVWSVARSRTFFELLCQERLPLQEGEWNDSVHGFGFTPSDILDSRLHLFWFRFECHWLSLIIQNLEDAWFQVAHFISTLQDSLIRQASCSLAVGLGADSCAVADVA